MKKVLIAQLGVPSIQWQAWIHALAIAGFETHSVSPLAIELQSLLVPPGHVLLIDGMMPRLSRFIQHTCAQSPDATIIVATETDSFTVKYEVLNQDGAIYVSGPMPADQFAATVQSVLSPKLVS